MISTPIGDVPLALIFFIITALVAVATAVYVSVAERGRKKVVERLGTDSSDTERMVSKLLLNPEEDRVSRLATWLADRVPTEVLSGERSAEKLLQAGFDGAAAPVLFGAIRIASLVLLPVLAVVFGPRDDAFLYLVFVLLAVVAGMFGPPAILDRLVTALEQRGKPKRAVSEKSRVNWD